MDPLLEIYLTRALDVLLTIGSVEIELLELSEEDDEAELLATVRFPNGSRLHVNMKVDEVEGFPYLNEYSFHYMAASNSTIFRYDNREHHYGLDHFPHHKHEGADERVVGCPQPSVSAIRDEIIAYLKG